MSATREEKIRVHQIAKDLNLESREVMKILTEMGYAVSTASSSVPRVALEKIKEKIAPSKPQRPRVVLRKAQPVAVPAQEVEKKVEPEPPGEEKEPAQEHPPTVIPTTGPSAVVPTPQPAEEQSVVEPIPHEVVPPIEAQKGGEESAKVKKEEGIKVIEPLFPEEKERKPPLRRKIIKRRNELRELKEEIHDDIFEEEIIFEEPIKKKKIPIQRPFKKTEITTPKASKKVIKIEEKIIVSELAQKMGVKANEVIKKLIELGVMANITQTIDADTAGIIAKEFGYEVERDIFNVEEFLKDEADDPQNLQPRPPVVTVMGHVDHGKTSLLDAIRQTNVAEGEAGGITQHIGAYEVFVKGKKIVFLDTPGHEAFTSMRARGAQVTDIVVLVVAADDGVMPQTIEALNHAKAAKVPVIVAINKIDKPNVNIHLVKQSLAEHGLVPEAWGGDTLYAEVSAKKKIGISELLDLILLQAEILELKANPSRPARGVVVESRLDRGRGPVATVIVQKGTMKQGTIIVAGQHYGRIRMMLNFKGERVDKATPSTPVEVIGLSGVPNPAEKVYEVPDEDIAEKIAEYFKKKQSGLGESRTVRYSLEDLLQQKSGDKRTLNLIIKADVIGSAEALKNAFLKLNTDKVECNVIHTGVGGITESDCLLASASKAIIIGFGVRVEAKAKEVAQREGVEIRFYDIIYDAIDDVKKAMEGLLEPVVQEKVIGRVVVRQIFKIAKVGTVAGSFVTDGKVISGGRVRILRDNKVIYTSRISSLKRFKDEVKEVSSGLECGLTIENFQDIKVGDIIEVYELEKVADHL